jgi:hypothetical protein
MAPISKLDILTLTILSIGTIILTSLSVRDFVPLLNDYENNNIATQINVINGDTNFTPPRLTVMIPFNEKDDTNMMGASNIFLPNSSIFDSYIHLLGQFIREPVINEVESILLNTSHPLRLPLSASLQYMWRYFAE